MSGAPVSRIGLDYDPSLDGLRGIAVLAIALYHAEAPFAGGGFLGVDAFFVLSGYLITRLLLIEHAQSGRIDLAAFWQRRVRRLLPALYVLMTAVAVLARVDPTGFESTGLSGEALATILYANNWWQIWNGESYFDAFAVASPLQHAWSLSVEEQWYAIWPILVALLLRGRRPVELLAGVSVVLALASALLAAWSFLPGEDPSRIYFGTDTRAQEILVGAVLACALHRQGLPTGRASGAVVALGSLAAIAWLALLSQASDSAAWLYRGGMLMTSVAVALVIWAAGQPGRNPLRTVLSSAPLRGLGIVSYGFYLWHWPIDLVLSPSRTGLEGASLIAVRLLLTGTIAALSYAWIERPIRRRSVSARVALGWAGAGALLTALVVSAATPGSSARDGADDAVADRQGAVFSGEPIDVLLVGDSVAWSLGNGFVPSIERRFAVRLENRGMPGCGLAYGPRRDRVREYPGNAGVDCDAWPEHWARYVATSWPDLVVLSIGPWDLYDRQVDGVWLEFGTPGYDAHLADLLRRATEVLTAHGARLVILTTPDFAPPDRGAAYRPILADGWRTRRINDALRAHALRHPERVTLIDLVAEACPNGDCRALSAELRSDGIHYSDAGARALARWLAGKLHDVRGPRLQTGGP